MIVHNFSILLTYFGTVVGHLAMGHNSQRHCFTSVGLLVAYLFVSIVVQYNLPLKAHI